MLLQSVLTRFTLLVKSRGLPKNRVSANTVLLLVTRPSLQPVVKSEGDTSVCMCLTLLWSTSFALK